MDTRLLLWLLGGLGVWLIIAKDERDAEAAFEEQLALGTEVELEHTDDPAVAEEIALDHLDELPDYYTRLAAMEAAP